MGAAFKEQSKKNPNYGKAVGMEAAEWWAKVGVRVSYVTAQACRQSP